MPDGEQRTLPSKTRALSLSPNPDPPPPCPDMDDGQLSAHDGVAPCDPAGTREHDGHEPVERNTREGLVAPAPVAASHDKVAAAAVPTAGGMLGAQVLPDELLAVFNRRTTVSYTLSCASPGQPLARYSYGVLWRAI